MDNKEELRFELRILGACFRGAKEELVEIKKIYLEDSIQYQAALRIVNIVEKTFGDCFEKCLEDY